MKYEEALRRLASKGVSFTNDITEEIEILFFVDRRGSIESVKGMIEVAIKATNDLNKIGLIKDGIGVGIVIPPGLSILDDLEEIALLIRGKS